MNAIVGPLGQPAVGTAKPGNLYADLASRTLWLGVATSVDPTGSVLISDMLQSMEAIEDSLEAAKAYTDAQLVPYARIDNPVFTGNPRITTHPSPGDADTSIASTKFVADAIVAAAATGGLMVGMILLYSGPIANIGVGAWANWRLCDGGGGTPDLRNRFVFGAGVVDSRTLNPKVEATTKTAGAHDHPVSATTLTESQIPAHDHGYGTLKGSVSTPTTLAGKHDHILTCTTVESGSSSVFRPHLVRAANNVNALTSEEPAHSHPNSMNTEVTIHEGKTANAGGGASHTHTTTSRGDHAHGVTSSELRDALPSMALAYIMKVS